MYVPHMYTCILVYMYIVYIYIYIYTNIHIYMKGNHHPFYSSTGMGLTAVVEDVGQDPAATHRSVDASFAEASDGHRVALQREGGLVEGTLDAAEPL